MSGDYFEHLRDEQYVNSKNLISRASLHDRFSVSETGLHQWEFDHLLSLEPSCLLEIGSGPALLWRKNGDRVPDDWSVTLTDLSPGMAGEAKAATESLPAGLGYAVVDGQAIPFAAETFDTVLANHMLYHLPDLHRALSEIRRVLEPGGTLLAATNGARHMEEIRELVHSLSADIIFGSLDACEDQKYRFLAENGAELLRRHFDEVAWLPFPDELAITEAQPLEDYILSFPGNAREIFAPPAMREGLQAAITDRMDAAGVFVVSKVTGMFVAS